MVSGEGLTPNVYHPSSICQAMHRRLHLVGVCRRLHLVGVCIHGWIDLRIGVWDVGVRWGRAVEVAIHDGHDSVRARVPTHHCLVDAMMDNRTKNKRDGALLVCYHGLLGL